jgi:hypothetical protein
MKERLDELLDEFATAAEEHFKAIECLDEDGANRLARRISLLYKIICAEEGGVAGLADLVDEPIAAVAGMAAVYSLHHFPERSIVVLERISKMSGLMGFRAQIALERWKKGELTC